MQAFSLITFDRFSQRLCGLMGKRSISSRDVFHLTPCNSVHTWGMHFSLSILFLDKQLQLLRFIDCLPPWRMVWHWRAHSVLELQAGIIFSEQHARQLLATLFP